MTLEQNLEAARLATHGLTTDVLTCTDVLAPQFGVEPAAPGHACDPAPTLPGAIRVLDDALAAYARTVQACRDAMHAAPPPPSDDVPLDPPAVSIHRPASPDAEAAMYPAPRTAEEPDTPPKKPAPRKSKPKPKRKGGR